MPVNLKKNHPERCVYTFMCHDSIYTNEQIATANENIITDTDQFHVQFLNSKIFHRNKHRVEL